MAGADATTTVSPDRASEVAELQAEVARLRELVGPSEDSYRKLQLDLLGARDAAVASESELGRLRGYARSRDAEIARLRRDYLFFRKQILNRVRKLKRVAEAGSRFVHQLLRG
jgi:hypothetical protein